MTYGEQLSMGRDNVEQCSQAMISSAIFNTITQKINRIGSTKNKYRHRMIASARACAYHYNAHDAFDQWKFRIKSHF